jgi:hypothetical protein
LCNAPYFLFSFIHIDNVDEVPLKLFGIRKQPNGLSQLVLPSTQEGIKNSSLHTSISSEIFSLTEAYIIFQLFTLISGAYFLVYSTTSLTNVRRFGPMGPPCLSENSTESIEVHSLTLWFPTVNPLTVPRPFFLR